MLSAWPTFKAKRPPTRTRSTHTRYAMKNSDTTSSYYYDDDGGDYDDEYLHNDYSYKALSISSLTILDTFNSSYSSYLLILLTPSLTRTSGSTSVARISIISGITKHAPATAWRVIA